MFLEASIETWKKFVDCEQRGLLNASRANDIYLVKLEFAPD
tara:strand:+ start:462 stop:584 length:123 start_codon:yes stop_codon:yes gene_type:complete